MSRTKKDAPPKDETASMFAAFEQAAGAAGLACASGKSAVDKRYRTLVDAKQAKTRFTGSVDLDAAFSKAEPDAHRWDFGLGVQLLGQKEAPFGWNPIQQPAPGKSRRCWPNCNG